MSICSNHISVLSFIPYVPLFTLGYSSGSLSQYISNNLYTFASNQTCQFCFPYLKKLDVALDKYIPFRIVFQRSYWYSAKLHKAQPRPSPYSIQSWQSVQVRRGRRWCPGLSYRAWTEPGPRYLFTSRKILIIQNKIIQ